MSPISVDNDDVGRSFRDDAHFEELRTFWSKVLGVYGPQWMIIVALQKLDEGEGVPVRAVATMLNVDPTFVTTHSRLLERKGFISRGAAGEFEQAMRLSLTDKAQKHAAELASRWRKA